MLGKSQRELVYEKFGVYDHNWIFFSENLGEPFLLSDILAYFDGLVLYLCAFSLDDIYKEFTCDDLLRLVEEKDEFKSAVIIDIWGNISFSNKSYYLNKQELFILKYSEKKAHLHDSIINIDDFNYSMNRKARLARNAAVNKGIISKVTQPKSLSFRHIEIIQHFIDTHDISAPHITMLLSIPSIIKYDNSFLIEAFSQGGFLLGFAVIMITGYSSATYTLACYNNKSESRAADSTIAKCIEFCKAKRIKYLHMDILVAIPS